MLHTSWVATAWGPLGLRPLDALGGGGLPGPGGLPLDVFGFVGIGAVTLTKLAGNMPVLPLETV